MKRLAWLWLCIAATTVLLSTCGGGGSDSSSGSSMYACSYEKRSSQTCNHYDYGAWTAGCYSFDASNYNISPQQVCSNMTQGGLSCASSCCIDIEYRNASLKSGSCP